MISGARIKRLRERLGESQAEFARRFRVDQSTVHRWEIAGGPARGPAALAVEQIIRELECEAA
jgi:DNA-binding transcriptional regulator YiaG